MESEGQFEKEVVTEMIEMYKSYKLLWDTSQALYCNKDARNKAYACLLNVYKKLKPKASLKEVRKKIDNLRSTYKREVKKVNSSFVTGSGSEEQYVPTLWYYELMLFLDEKKVVQPGADTMDEEDECSTVMASQEPIERLRFSAMCDIILLREVLESNPFEDSSVWNSIARIVRGKTGKEFSVRSLKEHLGHLLKLWTKQDLANLRKSGTEDEYMEKEHLLQQVKELKEEPMSSGSRKRRLERASQEIGKTLRDSAINGVPSTSFALECEVVATQSQSSQLVEDWMDNSETCDPSSTGSSSSTVRTVPTPVIPGRQMERKLRTLQYLENKEENDRKLKEAELQLRREELEFKKEQFLLEKEERILKMKIEAERHEKFMAQQNILLEMLLSKK